MRKVILAMFVSLDGYIEGPKGELTPPVWSDDLQHHWADANVDDAGLLLYGRTNFQLNAKFWQAAERQTDNSAAFRALTRKMNDLPKIVFSRTLKAADWNGRVVAADIAGEIARLKREPGKDLVMFGGADIANTFIGLDLIDAYRIMVTPTLLGDGKRLFNGGQPRRQLVHTGTQQMDTGAVILSYQTTPL
jgi:dihydrofolate reductase